MKEHKEFLEKTSPEAIVTDALEKENSSSVNFEQNINVVNIDMRKPSLLERFDLNSILHWIADHAGLLIVSGVNILLLVIMVFMVMTMASYKETLEDYSAQLQELTSILDNENIGNNKSGIIDTEESVDISNSSLLSDENNTSAETDTANRETEEKKQEISPETDLYKFELVGASNSKKRDIAKNTLGESLSDVFILSSDMYSETVGFYLDGKYDRFTATMTCDESTKKGSFDVKIYLDDDVHCAQTIHVDQLMTPVPIDIDTTGVVMIKFEITGLYHNHAAILSDGLLHIDESALK